MSFNNNNNDHISNASIPSLSPAEVQLLNLLRDLGVPLNEQDRSATSRKNAGKISLLPLFHTTLKDYAIYNGNTTSSASSSALFSAAAASANQLHQTNPMSLSSTTNSNAAGSSANLWDNQNRIPSLATGVSSLVAATASTQFHHLHHNFNSSHIHDQPIFGISSFLTNRKPVSDLRLKSSKENNQKENKGSESDESSSDDNSDSSLVNSEEDTDDDNAKKSKSESDDGDTSTDDDDDSDSTSSSSSGGSSVGSTTSSSSSSRSEDNAYSNRRQEKANRKNIEKMRVAARNRALQREQMKRPLLPVAAFAVNPWMGAAASLISRSANSTFITTTATAPTATTSNDQNQSTTNQQQHINEPVLNQVNFLNATIPSGMVVAEGNNNNNNNTIVNTNNNNENSSSMLFAPQNWSSTVAVPLAIVQDSAMRMSKPSQQLFSIIEDSEKFSKLLSVVGNTELSEETKAIEVLRLMGYEVAADFFLLQREQRLQQQNNNNNNNNNMANDSSSAATAFCEGGSKNSNASFYADLFGDYNNNDDNNKKSDELQQGKDDEMVQEDCAGVGFVAGSAKSTGSSTMKSVVAQRSKNATKNSKQGKSVATTQAIQDAFDQWNRNPQNNSNNNNNSANNNNNEMNTITKAKDEVEARDFLERARRKEYEEEMKLLRKDDQQQDKRRRQRDDPR